MDDLNELLGSDSQDSDDSTDSMLEVLQLSKIPKEPRQRVFFSRKHPLVDFDDSDFEKRFRFLKEYAVKISNSLESKLRYIDERNNPVSVLDQVLLTLRYYATGSFQSVVADLSGIHQVTCGRIIKRVSVAIAETAKDVIKMPSSPEEIEKTKTEFYLIHKFPNVIGIVDGTHIPILSPGGDDAETYRNRKTWFSINTQGVCDANMKFIDIVARWPGSTHDQTIFNFSKLRARFENKEFGEVSYLLGDAGYANKNYLLVPFDKPRNPAENKYNLAFIASRQPIECCYGIWKKRFPILTRKMTTQVDLTLIIIVATAVLHNYARDNGLEDIPSDETYCPIEEIDVVLRNRGTRIEDNKVRNTLAYNYFND